MYVYGFLWFSMVFHGYLTHAYFRPQTTSAGTITIDEGAVKALINQGKSLLATGITLVQGHFDRGQVIEIVNTNNKPLARGLTNYSDAELLQIQGKRSSEFADILGRKAFDEVIHRDNLTLADNS